MFVYPKATNRSIYLSIYNQDLHTSSPPDHRHMMQISILLFLTTKRAVCAKYTRTEHTHVHSTTHTLCETLPQHLRARNPDNCILLFTLTLTHTHTHTVSLFFPLLSPPPLALYPSGQ